MYYVPVLNPRIGMFLFHVTWSSCENEFTHVSFRKIGMKTREVDITEFSLDNLGKSENVSQLQILVHTKLVFALYNVIDALCPF